MTGFGDASANVDGVHYFLELRSLNNRYFKASIRLPDELQPLEAEFENKLKAVLHRGTVTLTVTMSSTAADAAFTVNHEALERYVEQVRRAPAVQRGMVSFDVSSLLTLPGVLVPPADEERRLGEARAALTPMLERAVRGVIETREREGGVIREVLVEQHDLISDRLETVREQAPAAVAEYQARLQARISALLAQHSIEAGPADIVREVAVYAEKADVAEEVVRLTEHLRHFSELISQAETRPVGRTLDFLAQEMLREANTISSKSSDAAIARATVEMKGAIDRIKEQAANAE